MVNIQENIKRMYSIEIKQTKPSTKTKSNANTNEEILKENSKEIKFANEKWQRSLIRPPDINRDIIEKTKDTAFKKQNSIKRITHPNNHFKQIWEVKVKKKISQISKLNHGQ